MERKLLPVSYLLNSLAPDGISICESIDRHIDKFEILVSVPMEGNRTWTPETRSLTVVQQRTKTIQRIDRHPSDYADANYVHVHSIR